MRPVGPSDFGARVLISRIIAWLVLALLQVIARIFELFRRCQGLAQTDVMYIHLFHDSVVVETSDKFLCDVFHGVGASEPGVGEYTVSIRGGGWNLRHVL